MSDAGQNRILQNAPPVPGTPGTGHGPQPQDDSDPAVAAAIAALLRQRFPQRRFHITLTSGQIIVQPLPEPTTVAIPPSSLMPAAPEAIIAPPVSPPPPDDCATCIATFLQQYAVHRVDGYTPVTTLLDALHHWRTAAGQPLFSDDEILDTLMDDWMVYQGAHEGWILDEYIVTYPAASP
ncbi:MAG: hypothetical protein AB7N91_24815 [Candidatus Tectimicrobiota bacterium]